MGLDPKTSYLFKAQGKPCSCILCSGYKYIRTVKHKKAEADRYIYRRKSW